MTKTLDCSSMVESSMADTTASIPQIGIKSDRFHGGEKVDSGCDGGGDDVEEEQCDVEAWGTLSKGFKQVQAVLDQNRELIQKVNKNHQSKIPNNLVENVALIREINGNISKVLGIYSDLSVDFSGIVRQRRKGSDGDVQGSGS